MKFSMGNLLNCTEMNRAFVKLTTVVMMLATWGSYEAQAECGVGCGGIDVTGAEGEYSIYLYQYHQFDEPPGVWINGVSALTPPVDPDNPSLGKFKIQRRPFQVPRNQNFHLKYVSGNDNVYGLVANDFSVNLGCGTREVIVNGVSLKLTEGVSSVEHRLSPTEDSPKKDDYVVFAQNGCGSSLTLVNRTEPSEETGWFEGWPRLTGPYDVVIRIPDYSSTAGSCNQGSPAEMSADDDGVVDFGGNFPVGNDSNGTSAGVLTWASATPQAAVQLSNWSYLGQDHALPGVWKNQVAGHLQIKTATQLLDAVEGSSTVTFKVYDLNQTGQLGALQNGFYPLPTSGLQKEVDYSYNATTGTLTVVEEQPGQNPQGYSMSLVGNTRTWKDEISGISKSITVTENSGVGSPAMDVRVVIREEKTGATTTSKIRETYRRESVTPPLLPGAYRLEESVVDPGGVNLVTTMWYDGNGAKVVRTLEPDDSWSCSSFVTVTGLTGSFGGADGNHSTLSNGDGLSISSVTYRPWLDGTMPTGDTPVLANCVAVVSKVGEDSVSGNWIQRTETWTAGVLTGRVDTYTTSETEGGQTYLASNTKTWNSGTVGDFLIRSEWTLNGRTYKVVNEDGTVRKFAYSTGTYTEAGETNPRVSRITSEWDAGTGLAGIGTRTVKTEDDQGRVMEKRLEVNQDGNGSYATMCTETWEYTGGVTNRLTEVKHYQNGLLADVTSYPTNKLTIRKTAGGPEVHTLLGDDGKVISVTEKVAGAPDIVTTTVTQGRVTTTNRSAGGLSQVNSTEVDAAGRTVATTDEQGITHTMSYAQGGRVVTTTRPGAVTEIVTNYLDGQTKSMTGSGVIPTYMSYAVETGGKIATTQKVGGENSLRATTSVRDWNDRVTTISKPSPALSGAVTETREYDSAGRLFRISSDDGLAAQVMAYNALGRVSLSGVDLSGDGQLTLASIDRITVTEQKYELIGGLWWNTVTQRAYHTNGNATDAYVTIQRQAMKPVATGTGGLRWSSVTVQPGSLTLTTARELYLTSQQEIATQDSSSTTASPDKRIESIGGRMISFSQYGTTNPSVFGYDALGRQIKTVDARGGVTRTQYNAQGLPSVVADHVGNATRIEYYPANHANAGRQRQITNPEGETTIYGYDTLGRVTSVTGTETYPLSYTYNAWGERETLTTYASDGSGATTTWNYDAATGVLKNKTYPGGKMTGYTYYAQGQVHVRTWQRGVTTTYSYDGSGVCTGINYSDTTPDVSITPDRLGRLASITDGGGTLTKAYHPDLPVETNDSYGSGHAFLPGVSIERIWDVDAARRDSIAAKRGGPSDQETATDYEASTGRIEKIRNVTGTYGHKYGYAPGTNLITGISHQNGGTAFGSESRSIDLAGRLNGIQTTGAGGAVLSRHGYTYDGAGRRTRATREDGSYWTYGYNDRGELTSGKKHLSGGTLLAGQQFEYGYDDIGNRTSAKSGGDSSGANLRSIGYTPNELNQYQTITSPGSFDVLGRAPAASTVTVNGQVTQHQGEIFRKEVSASNTSAPAWQSVSVSDGANTQIGNHFVPKASVSPVYDEDGNLTDDGRWVYGWDGENRLISMTTTAIAQSAGVPYRKLLFDYDWMSRRERKRVYHSAVGGASPAEDRRFTYDGWNLLSEYTASGSTLIVSQGYVWGTDFSGIEQRAGGVGGLLSVKAGGNSYVASYDGNGNVVGWMNSSGQLAAKQEYDPYGNRIVKEGGLSFPVGFSTKYTDEESSLCYYGYRYYSPLVGRWASRDPIEEKGGLNIYGFLGNSIPNKIDFLGCAPISDKGRFYGQLSSVSMKFKNTMVGSIAKMDDLMNRLLMGAMSVDKVYFESSSDSTVKGYYNTITNNIVMYSREDEYALHEASHAYTNNYLSLFRLSVESDEGMAYVIQYSYNVLTQLADLDNFLTMHGGASNCKEIKNIVHRWWGWVPSGDHAKWEKSWRTFWRNHTSPVRVLDVLNVKEHFGDFNLRGIEMQNYFNNLPAMKKCCIEVSVESYEKLSSKMDKNGKINGRTVIPMGRHDSVSEPLR